MEIHVTHVFAIGDEHHIQFDTAYGSGCGRWLGEVPQVGQMRSVELDVDEQLVWGINVFGAQTLEFCLNDKGGEGTTLQGSIVMHDEDVTSLRLGEGLLFLNIEGAVPGTGMFITLHTRALKVFDTAI